MMLLAKPLIKWRADRSAYPGGPSVQKAAVEATPKPSTFPRARLDGTWNFSFSGLKTAVFRAHVVRRTGN